MKPALSAVNETGRWALPFATIMLLLFSLFLGLYSLGKRENSVLVDEIATLKRSQPKAVAPATATSTTSSSEATAWAAANSELQNAIMSEARNFLSQDARGQNASGRSDVEVLDLAGGNFLVRVAVPDLFTAGSARVGATVRPFVDRLGQLVLQSGRRLKIEGHADFEDAETIQRKASEFSNTWELSAARAAGLAQYWMRKFDLEPSKIEVSGYGKFRPLDTSVKRSQQANRRIEVVILRNEND